MTVRAKRVSVGIALAAAAMVLAATLTWWFAGPALAGRWALDALQRRGVPATALTVRSLGFGRAEIVDVRIAWGEGLGIARIVVSYQPLRLIAEGRPERIEVSGVRFSVAGRSGPSTKLVVDSPPGAAGGVPSRLPFDHLALSDAVVTLPSPAGPLTVVVEAQVEAGPDGAAEARGRVALDGAAGSAALPVAATLHADGRIAVRVDLEAGRWRWRGVAVDGLTGAASLAGSLTGLDRVEGRFSAARVALSDGTAMAATAEVDFADGAALLIIDAAATAGGPVLSLEARAERAAGEVAEVALDFTADLPDLRPFLTVAGGVPPVTGEARVSMSLAGTVPAEPGGAPWRLSGPIGGEAALSLPVLGVDLEIAGSGVATAEGSALSIAGAAPVTTRIAASGGAEAWLLSMLPTADGEWHLSGRPGAPLPALAIRADYALDGPATGLSGSLRADLAPPDGADDVGRLGLALSADGLLPGGVSLAGAAAQGGLDLREVSGELQLSPAACLEVRADRLSVDGRADMPRGLDLCLRARADQPLLVLRPGDRDRPPALLRLAVPSAPLDLVVLAPGQRVPVVGTLPDLTVDAAIPPLGLPSLALSARGGALAIDGRLAIEAIEAEATAIVGDDEPGSAWLHRATLRPLGDPAPLAPLTAGGAARWGGQEGVVFDLAGGDADGALSFVLTGRHDPMSGSGSATFRIDPLSLSAAGPRAADLFPVLGRAGIEATGTVSAEGRADWSERMRSGGRLVVNGLSLAGAGWKISGIETELEASSLFPLILPEGQLIAIEGLEAGLRFDAGAAAIGVEGNRLSVQAMGFGLADGAVVVEPFTVTPGEPEQRLELEVERVDLARVSEQVAIEVEATAIVGVDAPGSAWLHRAPLRPVGAPAPL
ncbi:MAG: hypothetical protein HKM95_07055, partial [Inquilinus sp.]|nr:hypothetical protein [Inquilinus sp.]